MQTLESSTYPYASLFTPQVVHSNEKHTMINIFKKRTFKDLSWMRVDLHSHILPQLDDGATSLHESKEILDRLQALGLDTFYFTPHIMHPIHKNDRETIGGAFDTLRGQYPYTGLRGFAAEYMMDDHFNESLKNADVELLTLPGDYILVEMSYMQETFQVEKIIFDLQIKGLKPILAHPERYIYYQKDMEKIHRLRKTGCFLQVNILSLYGYYGQNEKQVARYLAEKKMIDFVGTDIHQIRHVKALERGLGEQDLWRYLKNCALKNQELLGDSAVLSP